MADFKGISDQIKNLANACGASLDSTRGVKKAIFRGYTPKEGNTGRGYLALTRGDQTDNGIYSGLSLVLFPIADNQENGKILTIIGLGIGTGNLGEDNDLANQPYARRLFTSLKYDAVKEVFHGLFVKNDFSDILNNNASLFDKIDELLNDKTTYSTDNYKLDVEATYGKYISAAILVDLDEDDLKNWNEKESTSTRGLSKAAQIVVAWIALYAKLRNWKPSASSEEKSGENILDKFIEPLKKPSKTFDESLKEVAELLRRENFIVLQGAPGSGKTYMANRLIENLEIKPDNVRLIQFHAETSYVDFIGGIRPELNKDSKDVKFTYEEGILTKIILDARKSNEKYLLIIDEINRANLANVLGETFYLFEKNTEESRKKIEIKVKNKSDGAKASENGFYIEENSLPNNIYVIATMNTADKSIATIDFALRRRFMWYNLEPIAPNIDKNYILDSDSSKLFLKNEFDKISDLFKKYASDEELDLQPGQSYFIIDNNKPEIDDQPKIKDLYKYKLMPLMKEYFAAGYLKDMKDEFANLYYEKTQENMYR